MGLWIRLEVDWQEDPYVCILDGIERHVLQTVWCLAARFGDATFDEDGEPLHAHLGLDYLEPAYLARQTALPVELVVKAMEKLRRGLPKMPPKIDVQPNAMTALIRNVGKYQRKVLKDRARSKDKQTKKPHPSLFERAGDSPRKVADVRSKVADSRSSLDDTKRNETKRNGTKQTTSSASPPRRARPSSNPDYPSAFLSFWSAYPRKDVGKHAGFVRWQKLLDEGESPGDLEAAAKNYATHAGQLGTETRFVKHAATFLSAKDQHWRDFVAGVPEIAREGPAGESPPTKPTGFYRPAKPPGELA